jgi:adenylylsulfate kinase
MTKARDTHARSVAKAVTWRILGTVTTSVLVFVFTRRLTLSLAVGALEFVSKIALFWFHERVWARIKVGTEKPEPRVLWFTGLSGSGKSTIAEEVVTRLRHEGHDVEHLDGDSIREVFPQTGFSREEREAHVRRVGFVASRLEHHGVTEVASLISPYEESREFVRRLCDNFIEIYVSTPVEECERRDVKGLYAKARRGEIRSFTGIDDPYEVPAHPDMTIDTRVVRAGEATEMILQRFHERPRKSNGPSGRDRGAERLHPSRGVRELQTAGDAVVDRKG